jgi:hypothetical protein
LKTTLSDTADQGRMIDRTATKPLRAYLPFALAGLLAIFFIATAVIGAVRWYSPVPFWDMWDGYLRFYADVQHGDWIAFFRQANEHRTVFSRVLFWLDLRFFGGRSLLLIATNVALMLSLWMALATAARKLLPTELLVIITAGIAAPCFSWMQAENITWGYQSSFFFAYLFPLVAFQCLAMSRSSTKSFIVALVMGVASLGTMANGVIVLPMMIVMYIMMIGASWKRAVTIALVFGVSIAIWLHSYTVTPHEKAHLLDFTEFVLIFLGAPLIHVFNSYPLGYVAGITFLGLSIIFLADWIRNRARRNPTSLALIMFCGYVCAAAIAAASGRASSYIPAALVSRYSTPTMFGWSAMAILVANRFRTRDDIVSLASLSAVFAAIALFPIQITALSEAGPESAHMKMTAAMAIRLGINDVASINNIYPTNTEGYRSALANSTRLGAEMRLSIFDDARLNSVLNAQGKSVSNVPATPCNGFIDSTEDIPTDLRYVRANGWAFDGSNRQGTDFVLFAYAGRIVGAGVTGALRPDVANVYGKFARRSGYSGFISSTAARQKVSFLCLS